MLDFVDQLLDLAVPVDAKLPVLDAKLGTGIEHPREHDLLGSCRDVDKSTGARRDMRAKAELRDVDRARLVDLEKRQQGGIKARALEERELMRRRHEGLGVRGAPESEVEQGDATDRPLFDDPGDRAVLAFLEENPRHV